MISIQRACEQWWGCWQSGGADLGWYWGEKKVFRISLNAQNSIYIFGICNLFCIKVFPLRLDPHDWGSRHWKGSRYQVSLLTIAIFLSLWKAIGKHKYHIICTILHHWLQPISAGVEAIIWWVPQYSFSRGWSSWHCRCLWPTHFGLFFSCKCSPK